MAAFSAGNPNASQPMGWMTWHEEEKRGPQKITDHVRSPVDTPHPSLRDLGRDRPEKSAQKEI